MSEGELRTVHEDGTVSSQSLTFHESRQYLAAWAAEQDAWEDYCRRKHQAKTAEKPSE